MSIVYINDSCVECTWGSGITCKVISGKHESAQCSHFIGTFAQFAPENISINYRNHSCSFNFSQHC